MDKPSYEEMLWEAWETAVKNKKANEMLAIANALQDMRTARGMEGSKVDLSWIKQSTSPPTD